MIWTLQSKLWVTHCTRLGIEAASSILPTLPASDIHVHKDADMSIWQVRSSTDIAVEIYTR